ncbi:hypothetical protein PHJA_000181600 [Phtheirospermum japonicum]|uniref:Uncharacterized protein n=1 Tax=Phtheirospermum japonicum TaxID=374723 RepID=A0A830B461_9LAMI|nr:hypothetical protein PHJA_000181600 [Phtheirospermum japonicum]
MDVKGARLLKGKDEVDQPQTFGSFPSPGFSGSFPSPGLGGSFPGPGLGGLFPSPNFSGSFPSPGLGFGPSAFCSFPGVQCAPVKPTNTIGPNMAASP